LQAEKIIHLGSLPYDETFTKAMTFGQTIIEYSNGKLQRTITESWKQIKQTIN